MRRFFFYSLGAVVLLWILLQLGLLPPVLARVVGPIVGLVCSLSLPLVFIMLYAAPGFLDDLRYDVHRFTSRFRSRRLEIEELQRRIAQLDKPHHMLELAKLLSSLGKPAHAIPWYQRVLEREPDTLEARYLLGLARAETGDINGAAELLEAVHARKPDHDYGQAYLRLAQVQARRGDDARARQVFEQMLRYYPGHAEALFHLGLLHERAGETEAAQARMWEVIASVRHSPAFQRRRTRHWALQARWWLWRRRRG